MLNIKTNSMKKILFSVALLVAAALSVSAQVSYSVSAGFANEVSTAIIDLGDGPDKTVGDPYGGFYVGAMASYELMPNVAVNGGLQFRYNGMNETDDMFGMVEIKSTQTSMSLEVPVRASYLLDLGEVGVFAYAGPMFKFGMVNKASVTMDDTKTVVNAYGEDGSVNRFNIMLGGGIGVLYHNLYAKVGYDLGLLNLSKYDEVKMRERGLKAGLGFCF